MRRLNCDRCGLEGSDLEFSRIAVDMAVARWDPSNQPVWQRVHQHRLCPVCLDSFLEDALPGFLENKEERQWKVAASRLMIAASNLVHPPLHIFDDFPWLVSALARLDVGAAVEIASMCAQTFDSWAACNRCGGRGDLEPEESDVHEECPDCLGVGYVRRAEGRG